MSTPPTILVTSYYAPEVTNPVLGRLTPLAGIRRRTLAPPVDRATLVAALRGCAVALISDERFDDEVFTQCPELRLVCCDGTGVDHVDLDAATRHGVLVTNAPVVHESCADLAMGLILAVTRGIPTADAAVRQGRWGERARYVTTDVFGRTLGLLGFGRVAQALARRAAGFGLTVITHSPRAEPREMAEMGVTQVGFDELLARSDILSLHVRLTDQKRGLIGASELGRMKDGAFLINTARGAVLDETALLAALQRGKLAGAGLDVLQQEPPPPDHPLLRQGNVVLSPHMGSDTRESFARVFHCVVDDILLYLGGQRPRHLVNAAAWERRRDAVSSLS